MDWVLEELKRCGVLPSDTHVDARMFAMRSADHVSVCVCVCVCKLFSNQVFYIYFLCIIESGHAHLHETFYVHHRVSSSSHCNGD